MRNYCAPELEVIAMANDVVLASNLFKDTDIQDIDWSGVVGGGN